MRWVRYAHRGETSYGRLAGDEVVAIDAPPYLPHRETGHVIPLPRVTLLPPVEPRTFYAAGRNYPAHFRRMAERDGTEVRLPRQADVGYRATNALTGADQPIVIPADSSGPVEFEAELVVVIGRTAKHLSTTDALDCVFGYTIGNDVSEREWQHADRTMWRAKNTDTFKPMGPWVDTDVTVDDSMRTTVRLNGVQVSSFRTADMVHDVRTYLVTMTRYLTLHPGDVLWMGTEEPTLSMAAGDVVEIDITGIGTLRNPVERADR